MEYKVLVVSANSAIGSNFEKAGEELSEAVNSHIAEGWLPQGGVSYAPGMGTPGWLTQALVRRAE